MRMDVWWLSHIALVLVCLLCHDINGELNFDSIDRVVNAGIGCHQTPGLSIAVVRNGTVVFSRGYGFTSVARHTPVTNTTLFGVASLSKAFTTTLLSKVLYEHSNFSVNTNIHYILGRNKFNNSLRSVYATVEDLMAHRMGVPRNNYLRLDDTLTRDNLLRRVKYLKSKGGFRDSFYYNDLMYGILTHITEIISGKSWEDTMKEKIFTPLHMDSSSFGTWVNFSASNVATPYVKNGDNIAEASLEFIRHWALIGGSGAVVSNAEDMGKWMLFQLSRGRNTEGVQVLPEDLLQDTHKPRNSLSSSTINKYFSRPETPVTMSNDGYALGWKSGYYRGLPITQHSGTTFGYASFMTLVPDKKLGVFVVMNGRDPNFYLRGSLSTHLLDVFLGETPWINSSTVCSFPSPWHSSRSSSRTFSSSSRSTRRSERNLQRRIHRLARYALPGYAGTYRNEAYGNLDVTFDLASNQLRAFYGIGRWILTSRGGNKFRAAWNGPPPSLNFDFNFYSRNGEIYKLIPSFEKKIPQVFYRIAPGNILMT